MCIYNDALLAEIIMCSFMLNFVFIVFSERALLFCKKKNIAGHRNDIIVTNTQNYPYCTQCVQYCWYYNTYIICYARSRLTLNINFIINCDARNCGNSG